MLVFLLLELVLLLALPKVLVGCVACRDRHAGGWSDVLRMLLPLLLVMALVHELRWWAAGQWCMVAAEMHGRCDRLCYMFWFVLLVAWQSSHILCASLWPAGQLEMLVFLWLVLVLMLALRKVLVGYVACRDRHAGGWSDVLRMLLPLLLVMALVHELRWWAADQWCMVAAEMLVLLVAWQSSHILCASLWPAGQLVMLVFLWLVLVLMLALPEVLVGYVACRDRHAGGWSDVLRMLLPLLLVMALVHELRWWAAAQWCMVAAEMPGRCHCLCLFWFVLLMAWLRVRSLCYLHRPACQVCPCLMWQHP